MALNLAALRDWGGEARLPFRPQAILIGLICFSAGGVPRLVPVLFGLLALIAAFHVFTLQTQLPVKLFKTAFGFVLALFIAYLFISGFEFWQTWMLGVVAFAWSTMLLAFRIPGLASLRADQADSTANAAGKAPLRATIA